MLPSPSTHPGFPQLRLYPCFLNLVFTVQNHAQCHHHQRWRISFLHISSASWSKSCAVSQICIFYTHTHTHTHTHTWASQVALVVKNPPVKAGDIKDLGLIYRSKFASTLLRIGWYLLVACKVTNSLCAGGTLHCSQGDVEMPLEEKYVALGSINILTRLQGQLRCYFFQKQMTWARQSWFRLCL